MPCQVQMRLNSIHWNQQEHSKLYAMKKIQFGIIMLAALLTGCKEEIAQPEINEGAELSATFANEDTRVYLGDDYYFRWEKGDLLSAFLYNQSHRKYEAREGDVIETLLDEVEVVTNVSEGTDGYNYAIFPYSDANAYDSGKLIANLPSVQSYDRERVNLNSAIMVARIPSSESKFYFKNSCALLKLNVTKTDAFVAKLKSITVTSSAHKIAGRVVVDAANEDYTAVIDVNDAAASNSITLGGCEEAGILSSLPLTFFIAIPAGTYEANDLTVTFDCDVDQLDCSKTIPTAYTVGRSKYLDLSTTLGEAGGWYEESGDGVYIDDATLTNKSIMINVPRLLINGWDGLKHVEGVFDVPESGDFKIVGKDLVDAGYAANGNPPVITHVTTDDNVYIMNTFTTNQSGLKEVPTPPTVTVENLTITGEYITNSLGEYVSDAVVAPNHAKPGNFSTVFTNVNVINSKVLPFNNRDKFVGAAVCINGTAVLENCVVKGTVKSDYWINHEEYQNCRVFDMACVNNSHTTLNGGEYGSIYTWEHLSLTVQKFAKVESIYFCANSYMSTSKLTVDSSEVGVIDCTDYKSTIPSLGTRISLKSNSKVGVLKMKKLTATKYSYTIEIDETSTIEKVIIDDVEMTLEVAKATYPAYFK